MSFKIYDQKRFRHPIRYCLLFVLLMITVFILFTVWQKQQQFNAQQENQQTLQAQLEKLNKQMKEAPKALISGGQTDVLPIIEQLNQYPRETILLKKLEYKKSLNQLEILGQASSIEDLDALKTSLLDTQLIQKIEILSTSALTESKTYKIEFSLKGTL
ncbi:hypothetical protein F3J02_05545 [Acinetobacter sp. Tr-809]|uniref:hypothetical protein n=1 Tax=Acinetobacter sp. Tr-809 TaxID=2608324 RepID=UPI00142230F0|nr:hypothetical protein [Acinetobacter sp. Tr-809]NIE95942.1 hypothetical protein [Acinetobacter sp. Tr-809]